LRVGASKGILSAVDGARGWMMKLNVKRLGWISHRVHNGCKRRRAADLFIVREVIDRLWNTIVTAGWDEPRLRAERFQRIGSSNVPALYGKRAE
jgi:hypothetical protein